MKLIIYTLFLLVAIFFNLAYSQNKCPVPARPDVIVQLKKGAHLDKHLAWLKKNCPHTVVMKKYRILELVAYAALVGDEGCYDKLQGCSDVLLVETNAIYKNSILIEGGITKNGEKEKNGVEKILQKRRRENCCRRPTKSKSKSKSSSKSSRKSCSVSEEECCRCGYQYNAPFQLLSLVNDLNVRVFAPSSQLYVWPKGNHKVYSYVLSTGIDGTNPDFGGRVKPGKNFVRGELDVDLLGAGTFAAGIIGSNTYGIAKTVSLISVKVIGNEGEGYLDEILSGFEWVAHRHLRRHCKNIASVMTLPFYNSVVSQILDNFLNLISTIGVHISSSNGNYKVPTKGAKALDPLQDACNYSPASNALGLTSANINPLDISFSSYNTVGKCIGILAFGTSVQSLAAPNVFYLPVAVVGDSAASAFVGGVMSLLLTLKHFNDFKPAELKNVIIKLALTPVVEDLPDETTGRVLSLYKLLLFLGCVGKPVATVDANLDKLFPKKVESSKKV